jgi:hypothetical protein
MRVKTIVWLLLLALVIHVGYKVLAVYIDYERMKDAMSVKASVAQVLSDAEILKDLAKRAAELDIPLKAEHFNLRRDAQRHTMSISTAWDEDVSFLGDLYVHTFHFAPQVEANIAKK